MDGRWPSLHIYIYSGESSGCVGCGVEWSGCLLVFFPVFLVFLAFLVVCSGFHGMALGLVLELAAGAGVGARVVK